MKQIVASVAGALILLKFVQLLLPEGSIKKYASVSVSALVVLVIIVSVADNLPGFSYEVVYEDVPRMDNTGNVINSQIMKEFSRKLSEDMKIVISELAECELEFVFSEKADGSYYVSSMVITSYEEANGEVIRQISELYSIDEGIISWRII